MNLMLELFDIYLSGVVATKQKYVRPPENERQGIPIRMDAKCVTLAQYDRVSKDVITAHNIAEYRRSRFVPALLPNIDIWFDRFVEGKVLSR